MKLDSLITKDALLDAVRQSLEGIAFLDVDSVEEELDLEPGIEFFYSEISILKPVKLKIIFLAPEKCARKLVESLYVDNSGNISDSVIMDVLAEMLNTTAGCFMKNILSTEKSYELGIPETRKGQNQNIDKFICKCVLRVSDEKMSVGIVKVSKSRKTT